MSALRSLFAFLQPSRSFCSGLDFIRLHNSKKFGSILDPRIMCGFKALTINKLYMSQDGGEDMFIKVNGLPWGATKPDILKFFGDIPIKDDENGIHMVMNERGRPVGVAYIDLLNQDDVDKALAKHQQFIGRRYINVIPAKRSELDEEINQSRIVPENNCCVRIHGLPFGSINDEIIEFFSGLKIDQIAMGNRGDAIIKFENEEDARKSIERHLEHIGSRYIEVFTSTEKEFENYYNYTGHNSRARGGSIRDTEFRNDVTLKLTGHVVRMQGLPFSTTEAEIHEFFDPINVVRILIEKRYNRATGKAEASFETHDDAVMAMKKDKEYIQHRYIQLFLHSNPNHEIKSDTF